MSPHLEQRVAGDPGRALQLFLMASYLYYEVHYSPLTDADFDALCVYLQGEYDFMDHPHLHLVSYDDLVAGTGYAIRRYPLVIQHAALRWMHEGGGHHVT